MIRRAFRFKLAPSAEQESAFQQFAGVTRLVYNLALEQRRDWWRQFRASEGRALNYVTQGPQVTDLRNEFPWIKDVPYVCLTQALRDLDKAFANFFSGRAGYPTPRRKSVHDTFRFKAADFGCRPINRKWAAIRVPRLGWVKFRATRATLGQIESATIKASAEGWHVIFVTKDDSEAASNVNPPVGIDRGIATSVALSNGESFSLPICAALETRLRRSRRILARRKIGSRRRSKQLRRAAKLSSRQARIRRDWLHRVSTDIANRFGAVALEDLKIVNMSASGKRKRGLNRSIRAQAWGVFATMLAYKLAERGGSLIKVNPAYTSQTCSTCGVIDKRSRESQASFVCTSCGFAINADHNAAINILRRSTSDLPVEGCGYAPVEAGTSRIAA